MAIFLLDTDRHFSRTHTMLTHHANQLVEQGYDVFAYHNFFRFLNDYEKIRQDPSAPKIDALVPNLHWLGFLDDNCRTVESRDCMARMRDGTYGNGDFVETPVITFFDFGLPREEAVVLDTLGIQHISTAQDGFEKGVLKAVKSVVPHRPGRAAVRYNSCIFNGPPVG